MDLEWPSCSPLHPVPRRQGRKADKDRLWLHCLPTCSPVSRSPKPNFLLSDLSECPNHAAASHLIPRVALNTLSVALTLLEGSGEDLCSHQGGYVENLACWLRACVCFAWRWWLCQSCFPAGGKQMVSDRFVTDAGPSRVASLAGRSVAR